MMPLSYQEKKAQLIASLKQSTSPTAHQTLSLKKDRSNLFRPHLELAATRALDVRRFNCVINVDRERLLLDIEGMATYEAIAAATLDCGCLPAVVPELKSITAGGAVAGCGIESSSFRYGLVHETVTEAEVLLSSGEVVICTPHNEHRDLFLALPNSFGSLGYLLRLQMRLYPAKPYVKLTNLRFCNAAAYFTALQQLCCQQRGAEEIAFIDGVIFSPEEMYIVTGAFVDQAPYISDYTYRHIYYRSIRQRDEDFLTTKDYVWRWDTDWFWCSKVFGLQNPVLRALAGRRLLNSPTYTWVMNFFQRHPWLGKLRSGAVRYESLIQDVLIPAESAGAFFEFFKREIAIFPVWICPAQSFSPAEHYPFCPLVADSLYFDFGFWDSIRTFEGEGFYGRKIEAEVIDLRGFKSLYSTSYYSEEQFWELYNHGQYMALKERYDPQGLLRDLYQKTVAKSFKG
jgi:FAD/FMN-containing dehydrogenase